MLGVATPYWTTFRSEFVRSNHVFPAFMLLARCDWLTKPRWVTMIILFGLRAVCWLFGRPRYCFYPILPAAYRATCSSHRDCGDPLLVGGSGHTLGRPPARSLCCFSRNSWQKPLHRVDIGNNPTFSLYMCREPPWPRSLPVLCNHKVDCHSGFVMCLVNNQFGNALGYIKWERRLEGGKVLRFSAVQAWWGCSCFITQVWIC